MTIFDNVISMGKRIHQIQLKIIDGIEEEEKEKEEEEEKIDF